MNSPTFLQRFALCARIIVMCSAGMLLTSTLQAQLGMGGVDSRFLLIFDTSSAMKARVPATQYAVERLFFSMMNGQLQSGDTIGVWTFDRTLRKGGFPLQGWLPQNAAMIASNITNFVRLQHYSKRTGFDMLMPQVNGLVQNSERLTVLIFCDGDGAIKGTPYDNAINSVFKQSESALKKADQTFIVVLRAQFGQYTGYTVNSSAIGVNFPDFPPLPQPPQPIAPAKTNLPPPPPPTPVVTAPPLVIVGTNVGTNLLPTVPARSVLSNPPPVKLMGGTVRWSGNSARARGSDSRSWWRLRTNPRCTPRALCQLLARGIPESASGRGQCHQSEGCPQAAGENGSEGGPGP